jgi:hypothetical protein
MGVNIQAFERRIKEIDGELQLLIESSKQLSAKQEALSNEKLLIRLAITEHHNACTANVASSQSYAITKLSRGATGVGNEGPYAMLDIAGNVDGKLFAFSVPDGIFAHLTDPDAFIRAQIAGEV